MKKRGISAVVATILIILIVVVGVGIVWKVILPLFAELEFLSYSDVQLKIVRQGFTVYDEDQHFAFVQIERGKDEVNVTGIEIGFNFNGTTKTYQSMNVPEPNGKYTYKFNFTNDTNMGIPDGVVPSKVTVAPIFKIKDKVRLGKVLDSQEMPVGKARLSAAEWAKANKEAATPIVVTTGSGGGEEPGKPVVTVDPEIPEPVESLIICDSQNNSAYDNGTFIETCGFGCTLGVCNEDPTCKTEITTDWLAGLDGCDAGTEHAPKRCYEGECIECGGWGNGGLCWYDSGSPGISCTTVCSTRNGTFPEDCHWVQDPDDCSTCQHFHPNAGCWTYPFKDGPYYWPEHNKCRRHSDDEGNCNWSGRQRQCACNI